MRTLILAYLNSFFYLLLVFLTFFSAFTLTPLVVFMRLFLSARRTMELLRRLISFYGKAVIWVLPFPFIKVYYKKLSECKNDGAAVFVCNHRSSSDPFLMGCLSEEAVQVVNIWPFHIPVLGVIAKLAGYLSVREMAFEEFSRRASKMLDQGISLIAFPEGTRSGSRIMGRFHSAVFRVALESRYSIVPLCICGNENIPSRGSFMLHPGIIRIHRLAALKWQDFKDYTPFVLKNKVRDMIAAELVNMESN
jgi:1-acyl-sn-glycerol-3-phosphate acyltransferase